MLGTISVSLLNSGRESWALLFPCEPLESHPVNVLRANEQQLLQPQEATGPQWWESCTNQGCCSHWKDVWNEPAKASADMTTHCSEKLSFKTEPGRWKQFNMSGWTTSFLYKRIASLVNIYGKKKKDMKLMWESVITWPWIGGKYPVHGKRKRLKDAVKPEERSWTMFFTWQAFCHCSSRPSVWECTSAVLSSFWMSCQGEGSLLSKTKRCKVKWDPSRPEEDWAGSVSTSGDGAPSAFLCLLMSLLYFVGSGCDRTVLRGLLCCYPWVTMHLEGRAAVVFSCVQSSSVYKMNG